MTIKSFPPPSSLDLSKYAIFLDFDGTLVDIAPTPDTIKPDVNLPNILVNLSTSVSHALALVSGRPIHEIKKFVSVNQLSIAGCHGAEWCLNGEAQATSQGSLADGFDSLIPELCNFADKNKLFYEDKGHSFALHFRDRSDMEDSIDQFLHSFLQSYPELVLLKGKCIREIKEKHSNKGVAIERFLKHPPFNGRIPLFIGDDVTDEDAFAVVNQLNGISIKVGEEDTQAKYQLAEPADVLNYLKLITEDSSNA